MILYATGISPSLSERKLPCLYRSLLRKLEQFPPLCVSDGLVPDFWEPDPEMHGSNR
jgi:hypothetical protein